MMHTAGRLHQAHGQAAGLNRLPPSQLVQHRQSQQYRQVCIGAARLGQCRRFHHVARRHRKPTGLYVLSRHALPCSCHRYYFQSMTMVAGSPQGLGNSSSTHACNLRDSFRRRCIHRINRRRREEVRCHSPSPDPKP